MQYISLYLIVSLPATKTMSAFSSGPSADLRSCPALRPNSERDLDATRNMKTRPHVAIIAKSSFHPAASTGYGRTIARRSSMSRESLRRWLPFANKWQCPK